MKAKWIFALAMAGLVFASCDKKEKGQNTPESVVILMGSNQYTVAEDSTVQVEYTVTPEGTKLTWRSENEAIATVDQSGLVTGIKAGTTVVHAAAQEVDKKVIIRVTAAGGMQQGEKPEMRGSQFWPLYLDGEIVEANQSKMVFSFRTDNTNTHFDWWENTYAGGNAGGSNYFLTNAAGGFISVRPNDGVTWSGAAFRMSATALEHKAALVALVEAIKAEPAKYHLHMAIKSTNDGGSHYFTLFGLGAANAAGLKWCVGEGYESESNGRFDIAYNGKWNVIDFSFDRYAAALEAFVAPAEDKGINFFTFGSGKDPNNVLNIDAIYIYKE